MTALFAIYHILIKYDKTNILIAFVHHSNLKRDISLEYFKKLVLIYSQLLALCHGLHLFQGWMPAENARFVSEGVCF